MAELPLLGVPNFSEGRDPAVIEALERALESAGGEGGEGGEGAGGAARPRLLDAHSDTDHNRTVFTLASSPRGLGDAMLRAAAVAVEEINVMGPAGEGRREAGQHPHVGALDVAPIVFLDPELRGTACAEALVLADRIAQELAVPVFLYGDLTASVGRAPRTRAELRRGGVAGLARRMSDPDEPLVPDFGPSTLHPTAGATLVAAREPLVAFNLLLAGDADLDLARSVAASIREGGADGLPGVRAMGILLEGRGAQVSLNIEHPLELPLAEVVAAVSRLAPVAEAELVGLAPRAAMAGFPDDTPMPGFDPERHLIENALAA